MLRIERGGSPYGARLITDQPICAGTLISQITGYQVTPEPTYQTVQVAVDKHIEDLGVLAYLNHSCEPNTIVNTIDLTVIAIRDIGVGDEMSFFYPSTEWEMDRPFICLCGSPQCVRLVAGARYLSIDTLSRYYINQHICELAIAALNTASYLGVNPAVS